MPEPSSPIRLAVVNDYELVVSGIAAVLAPYSDAVEVVELDSRLPVVSDVDVLLYDTFAAAQGNQIDLDGLFEGPVSARVVVYSWNTRPDLVAAALDRGAAGYLSKALSAADLVRDVTRIFQGEVVTPLGAAASDDTAVAGTWPGQAHGLSARESEIVALITQGLTNDEIARQIYLSINSIKTYIRTAYRKMGVVRRSQAVAWGMKHGMSPDRVRTTRPAPTR